LEHVSSVVHHVSSGTFHQITSIGLLQFFYKETKNLKTQTTTREMNMIQADCCKEMFKETKKNGNPNNKQELNKL
jgi:hypothetical protein